MMTLPETDEELAKLHESLSDQRSRLNDEAIRLDNRIKEVCEARVFVKYGVRERERITLEKLKSAEASIDTYREQVAFLSDDTLPHHIVEEVKRLNKRRRKIANAVSILWDEHKEYSREKHGVEGCDAHGTDSEGHEMLEALVENPFDETP